MSLSKLNLFQSCNAMKDINRKLFDKPNSIEELVAIQEWMKSIPEKLREHTVGRKLLFKNCFQLELSQRPREKYIKYINYGYTNFFSFKI